MQGSLSVVQDGAIQPKLIENKPSVNSLTASHPNVVGKKPSQNLGKRASRYENYDNLPDFNKSDAASVDKNWQISQYSAESSDSQVVLKDDPYYTAQRSLNVEEIRNLMEEKK